MWVNKFFNLERKKGKQDNALYWTKDWTFVENGKEKTVKQFASATIETIFNILKRSPSQRIMYEHLQSNDPQCFVLDVDYKYGKDGDMNEETCYKSLIEEIIPAVERTAKELDIKTVVQPQLFSSCREDKFSYHVHFPSYYFADRNVMSFFAGRVWEQFRVNDVALTPDRAIYGNGKRAFRLVYNSKIGNPAGAKRPVDQCLSAIEKATVQDFSKMLVRTQHEGVSIIQTLQGYNSENKYGQPGGSVKKMTTRKSKVDKKNVELTDVTDNAIQGKYVAALQQFHEEHADRLTWNENQVYSVRQGVGKIDIRIQPSSDAPATCWRGCTHQSNGIMYTLDPVSLRVLSTHCFSNRCGNKYTRIPQNVTNQCSHECTESSAGRVGVHVCSNSKGDLVTIMNGDEEHYEIRGKVGPCNCEGEKCRCKKYHSDSLIRDLCDHIDEVLDPEEDCDYSTFYLLGSQGSGKTTALAKVLDHFTTVKKERRGRDATMLVHTSRQALAYQLLDTLRGQNFVLYKDLRSSSDAEKLIMQVESTHKLFGRDEKGNLFGMCYDVLVVDEAFAHLKQLVASTMPLDRQQDTIRYFNWLLRSAKLVIVLCADTQEKDFVFDYFESRRRAGKLDWQYSEQVFRVISPGAGLTVFMESAENVQAAVCCALDHGEHVWFSTNSRKEALQLKNLVQERATKNKDIGTYNGILLVSGDKRDISEKQKQKVLNDKELTQHTPKMIMDTAGTITTNTRNQTFPVKLFIYTPAITHGFSFDDKEGYFTKFMSIYRASDVPARDCRQQLKRNRNARVCLVGIRQKIIDDEQDDVIASHAELITENNDVICRPEQHQPKKKLPKQILDVQDMRLIRGVQPGIDDDAEASRKQLNEFYAAEALKSKLSFKEEFLRLCDNEGIHVVFLKDNSDGFIEAHSQFVNELTEWTHLQNLCKRAAQAHPDKCAPEETPERFHFDAALLASRESLSGCPKTLAVISSFRNQIELFGAAMKGEASHDVDVFLNFLKWFGISIPSGRKVPIESLKLLQTIHTTSKLLPEGHHLLSSFEVFEKTFRIVYSGKPKQLAKLPTLKVNWTTEMETKKKLQLWNNMCNYWLKLKFGELIDTTAERPKITSHKLRVSWPLKTSLFECVLLWADALVTDEKGPRPGVAGVFHTLSLNSIEQISEDNMPDICDSHIKAITTRLQDLEDKDGLQCNWDKLDRSSSSVNQVAAQYRFANGQNKIDRIAKLTTDEYLSKKRTSGLAFPNAIFQNPLKKRPPCC